MDVINCEIIRFNRSNVQLLDICLEIRRNVFIIEQGISRLLEYDDDKVDAFYLLIKKDNKYLGTCRWRKTNQGIKLERFAVLSEYRNTGVGSVLLQECIMDAKKGGRNIYIHSQESAVNFYIRNGFSIQGPAFTEAGIKHYFMKLGV